jgi:hypothetical protein
LRAVLLIYVVGVLLGLAFTDGRPLTRVVLALAWPVAPLAFVVVVSGLLLAALYIFPVFGAVVAVLGALAGWWVLSSQ